MTLICNIFGGPGSSKSTTAAYVYAKLKSGGYNAELATEYAKDLTWEGRSNALAFQPYVAAKQMWRIHRLIGKVDVIVTDSPIILSAVYKGEGYTPSFEAFLFDTFNGWNNLNVELQRHSVNHPYVTAGRSQTEEEAKAVDDQVDRMLHHHAVPHTRVNVGEGDETSDKVFKLVKRVLSGGSVLQTVGPKIQKLSLSEQKLQTTPT